MQQTPEEQIELVRQLLSQNAPQTNWMQLAALADRLQLAAEAADCYLRAIQANRNEHAAYLQLAIRYHQAGESATAFVMLKEASRAAPLPEAARNILAAMEASAIVQDDSIRNYLSLIGKSEVPPSRSPLRILVVTNLFPPQELGGYGRTMWEFCDILQKRGHALQILTSDTAYLHKDAPPERLALEPMVQRSLQLFGTWENGKAEMTPSTPLLLDRMDRNARRIQEAIHDFHPDALIVGNLDFVGWEFLKQVTQDGIPILHRLGNESPGYPPEDCPDDDRFCIAGCSAWLNQQLIGKGYPAKRYSVITPGSPIEDYYRFVMPSFHDLRLCFAGLLMPYKGCQTLLYALAILKQNNIPFQCEIAGDSTDPEFLDRLKAYVEKEGMGKQIRFLGFLDKPGLAALYARSNVMVFPSVFDEPFGKSQIEAMAAGCLVASSGTGGSREIVRNRENGLTFEKENHLQLAQRLVDIRNNPSQAEAWAAQGQSDAFQYRSLLSVEKIEQELAAMLPSAKANP